MAAILAVVSDLMLASRVDGALRAAGHDVTVVGSLPLAIEADAVVCDLDAVDPAEVVGSDVPSLGFYSHVDVEVRRRAEAAGMKLVVPRSRMSRELPDLVERLLAG